MKKVVISLTLITAFAFGQSETYSPVAVAPAVIGSDTLWGGSGATGARGVVANVDVDQDGKWEVYATSYENGGQVYGFEYTGGDTMELIWVSKEADADYSSPRDVHVADLDGDGYQEIVFHIGRYPGSDANLDDGIQIYEWDGTDNGLGSTPDFQINFMDALNDSLAESRVEGFSIADIDQDGQEEILLANNGSTNPVWGTVDGSTPYSGDRFIILHVDNIGEFGTTVTEEFSMSPRDVDKDGVRENGLGGGSPQDIVVCDTDGDGNLEAACISYNNLALFFIEATGPDTYTIGDTGYVKLAVPDDWTLGASVADLDGNGKDEVYIPGYYDGKLFVVTDSDDDATSIDTTGQLDKSWAGNSEVAFLDLSGYASGTSAFGDEIYGGSNGGDFYKASLVDGGSVLDSSDFNITVFSFEDYYSGGVNKLFAGSDVDTDGYIEAVLAYQSVPDSIEVISGTDTSTVVNPTPWVIRIVESDVTLSVRDMTIITPQDYTLKQNYPNPFNPTTTIEYYLPIKNNITLTVYNMLGQEVVKLVDNKPMTPGSHSIIWNGLDANGIPVSSGTYIYELRFGNFSKTEMMTLLK